jgi:hypothetical protein
MSSPSRAFGTSSASCARSRRPLVKLLPSTSYVYRSRVQLEKRGGECTEQRGRALNGRQSGADGLFWVDVCRSARRSRSSSRTSVSGSATTRVLEPTTCTRSSASCRAPTLSTLATRTWPPATALASVRSRCARRSRQSLLGAHLPLFVQILRVAEIEKTVDIRRPHIKQLLTPNLRFPLPHRVVKSRSLFLANRPSTFY